MSCRLAGLRVGRVGSTHIGYNTVSPMSRSTGLRTARVGQAPRGNAMSCGQAFIACRISSEIAIQMAPLVCLADQDQAVAVPLAV